MTSAPPAAAASPSTPPPDPYRKQVRPGAHACSGQPSRWRREPAGSARKRGSARPAGRRRSRPAVGRGPPAARCPPRASPAGPVSGWARPTGCPVRSARGSRPAAPSSPAPTAPPPARPAGTALGRRTGARPRPRTTRRVTARAATAAVPGLHTEPLDLRGHSTHYICGWAGTLVLPQRPAQRVRTQHPGPRREQRLLSPYRERAPRPLPSSSPCRRTPSPCSSFRTLFCSTTFRSLSSRT
jgi:hypothetical protein